VTTLPPPPPPRPSGTTSTFPPPTGAQLLRALRAPAIGYAWLLLAAVAAMVLIVVAANLDSSGSETGVESDDTNAIGVLVGMPFQLAAMALLGSLQFSEDGIRASIFFPPLVLSAVYLVMTARAARRGEVVPAVGTRALLAVIVGFAAAVVVTPLTWVLAMRSDGTAFHAASVSLFFGTWALTALASYAGASRAAGARRPAWIPSDYAAAARVWVGSVALWGVVAVVVLAVVAAVEEGVWLAVLFPLWGPTIGLDTYAIAHLGGLRVFGEGVNIGDLSAVWTILAVVGALVLAALTSLAWSLRRDSRDSSLAQPGSWVVLPATYAVGGLLVWLVPSVVLGGGYGGLGGSATVQPAFWTAFVLLAWGVVVEVASRFVAPSLVPALPPRLVAQLKGPERVQTPWPDVPAPSAAEPRPLTPEERARYKVLGVVAGAVALVGIVGWIAVSVASSQFYRPEDQAAAYLDAIVDADLDRAGDLAPTDDQADDSLLTREVYEAASARITGYELGDVETDGDTATVDVRLEGLGRNAEAQLVLEKDGHRSVIFDDWRIADAGLAKVVSVMSWDSGDVTVNDVAVDAGGGDLWLLPGDYVVDASAGNQWLEGSDDAVTVSADDDYQYVDVPTPTASEAFRTEVQRQVDDYLAACIASTELDPDDCPNSTYGGYDVRNVVWTLDEAPTPDFDYFDGTFPADLGYGDSGQATVTYEADESYGFGQPDWQPVTEESDLYLSSIEVDEDGDGLAVTVSD
jgi:hypothetical protein